MSTGESQRKSDQCKRLSTPLQFGRNFFGVKFKRQCALDSLSEREREGMNALWSVMKVELKRQTSDERGEIEKKRDESHSNISSIGGFLTETGKNKGEGHTHTLGFLLSTYSPNAIGKKNRGRRRMESVFRRKDQSASKVLASFVRCVRA